MISSLKVIALSLLTWGCSAEVGTSGGGTTRRFSDDGTKGGVAGAEAPSPSDANRATNDTATDVGNAQPPSGAATASTEPEAGLGKDGADAGDSSASSDAGGELTNSADVATINANKPLSTGAETTANSTTHPLSPTPTPVKDAPTTLETSVDTTGDTNATSIDVANVVDSVSHDEKIACAQGITGSSNTSNVVAITGNKTVVTAESIIIVSLGGSAKLVMSAPIQVYGFCLVQRGGSNARIAASLSFARLAVFSGGSPHASFVLADGSSLKKFYASAGGNATVGVFGPNLDCDNIVKNAVVNGNPTINCGAAE